MSVGDGEMTSMGSDNVSNREHSRVPSTALVEYRSASSFLIAYASNMSRGGLFLETDSQLPIGTELAIRFSVPGADRIEILARVAWRRDVSDHDGPKGLGLEFGDLTTTIGGHVDAMVAQFRGIKVALLARDGRSSAEVGRALRSAISSAQLIELSEASFVETFGDRCDLLVVDADSEPDGGIEALNLATQVNPPIPTIVLSADETIRDYAEAEGATALPRPPSSSELGKAAVRALGKPVVIVDRRPQIEAP